MVIPNTQRGKTREGANLGTDIGVYKIGWGVSYQGLYFGNVKVRMNIRHLSKIVILAFDYIHNYNLLEYGRYLKS